MFICAFDTEISSHVWKEFHFFIVIFELSVLRYATFPFHYPALDNKRDLDFCMQMRVLQVNTFLNEDGGYYPIVDKYYQIYFIDITQNYFFKYWQEDFQCIF